MTSYPTAAFRRPCLAPSVIASITLVAGAALLGTTGFVWILYAISILAAIDAVFVIQAGQYWWLVGLVPIVAAWNPVVPIPFDGPYWQGAQFVASIFFITVGVLVKVPNTEPR